MKTLPQAMRTSFPPPRKSTAERYLERENERLAEKAEMQRWVNAHRGRFIRRKNGGTVYVLKGLRDAPGGAGVSLMLERARDGHPTWVAAGTYKEFVACAWIGHITTTQEDDMDATTLEQVRANLARQYDAETLEAALKKRREIEAKAAEERAATDAAVARAKELREAAIAALEKAAKEGDVGAAAKLLDL